MEWEGRKIDLFKRQGWRRTSKILSNKNHKRSRQRIIKNTNWTGQQFIPAAKWDSVMHTRLSPHLLSTLDPEQHRGMCLFLSKSNATKINGSPQVCMCLLGMGPWAKQPSELSSLLNDIALGSHYFCCWPYLLIMAFPNLSLSSATASFGGRHLTPQKHAMPQQLQWDCVTRQVQLCGCDYRGGT